MIRHSSESWNPTSFPTSPQRQRDSSFRWNDERIEMDNQNASMPAPVAAGIAAKAGLEQLRS